MDILYFDSAMRVFIANFGRENYAWSECLERSAIATMNAQEVQGFWESGDRESYVNYCIDHMKTSAGIVPTRPVASRWFNLMTVLAETSGDIWIHREKDQLWWTASNADTPTFEPGIEPVNEGRKVVTCYKPCAPWSNSNRTGHRLDWNGLHPRACEFLFTEGTLQQLSEDNAAYALALINGDNLDPWHSRAEWQERAERARGKRSVAKVFNAKERAIARMAMTAMQTVSNANGQQVLRNIKVKELRFPSQLALERYISNLVEAQEGLCAITGLRLEFDGDSEDAEMLCSLDRIDSDGHYEEGNLQVVCRFINRWKSDANDSDFRRLIGLVKSIGALSD